MKKNQLPMRLFYDKEIERTDDDYKGYNTDGRNWEKWSLPLGNGFIGANVFGYVNDERVQITENSFSNPYKKDTTRTIGGDAGLTCFENLYFTFNHSGYTDYVRTLDIDNALCKIEYNFKGVNYKREYFTSYPDKVLVIKFSADKENALDFDVSAQVPYIDDYCNMAGDGLARTGHTEIENDTIIADSELAFYDVKGEGRIKIINDGGELVQKTGKIGIVNANSVVMIYACKTNYKMEERVFFEDDPKKKLAPYPHPREEVKHLIENACKKSYDKLLSAHLADYHEMFGRVKVNIGGENDLKLTTDVLVNNARNGIESKYLEMLLFQYGRYLLISSSRPGGYPANLQGIWSNYRSAPWSSGYWHNINVQMNYWPSEITDIAECFIPYIEYNQVYINRSRQVADDYIKKHYPENYKGEGTNGWTIGTGSWLYRAAGGPGGHSGPGTGAFTSLLFWDYYVYTGDKKFLKEIGYPVIRDMSLFFTKVLKLIDGKYLVPLSESPEQMDPGNTPHHTVGCAFDQQMIYENYSKTLEAAEILEIKDDPLLDTLREQIDKLEPVIIGKSGQVKEFREEEYYGEIGDPLHRHISHLVGLYPGTIINSETPAWLEAAKVTLTKRGDKSTGWATAHRLLLWTRAKMGNRSHDLMKSLLKNNINENLWDVHPPFQIDGNLGYTAGVAEMFVQSQAGYIDVLPSIPDCWENGSFDGIKARGNFKVSCDFENSKPTYVKIKSNSGSMLSFKNANLKNAEVLLNGKNIGICESDYYSCETNTGDVYEFMFR